MYDLWRSPTSPNRALGRGRKLPLERKQVDVLWPSCSRSSMFVEPLRTTPCFKEGSLEYYKLSLSLSFFSLSSRSHKACIPTWTPFTFVQRSQVPLPEDTKGFDSTFNVRGPPRSKVVFFFRPWLDVVDIPEKDIVLHIRFVLRFKTLAGGH